MPKFSGTALVAASKYIGEVEAATKEEAEDKLWAMADYPSICHACAKEVEIGDVYEIEVEEVT